MPTKRKTYWIAARVEVDDAGNFQADIRQINVDTQKKVLFETMGPLVWSERITSYIVKAFINEKLKLFT